MVSRDLQLYSKYAEGMRYLLAQSPDTRDLVPELEEGKWERIGKKKDVEVTSLLADYKGAHSSQPDCPDCLSQDAKMRSGYQVKADLFVSTQRIVGKHTYS